MKPVSDLKRTQSNSQLLKSASKQPALPTLQRSKSTLQQPALNSARTKTLDATSSPKVSVAYDAVDTTASDRKVVNPYLNKRGIHILVYSNMDSLCKPLCVLRDRDEFSMRSSIRSNEHAPSGPANAHI